ncbi:MAG: carbamoyltransferase HypF [Methanomassiliicoccus sp.]|nr:carbamoyltransferase HypF [Methanomassiliicoccus sp.]
MRIVVHGIVQGVGFRPTVYRIATSMGLRGYVQNNGSNVVIMVDRQAEEFVRRLKDELPPLARIDAVEMIPSDEACGPTFRIVASEAGQRGVGIPNDTAVCDACLKEMFDPSDRRYLYPFTNCTNCGARFTVIIDLPYDREKTSMRDFPMDPDCRNEYDDPRARRFHHQTISCPHCGPSYYLLDGQGKVRESKDPIKDFAQMLESGHIGVAKSWGGMHLCTTLSTLPRLREWYHRKEKPFAIMVRDMEAARRYGAPTESEEKHLTSSHRPVVLVRKRPGQVTELISPGLSTIGLFLPYAGMHHLLFRHLKDDALVMTSANVPGEPMVLRDTDALELGADVYLMHDREIINRCDDSVLRTYGEHTYFIRRSRGHIPSSIDISLKGSAIGLGAQENLCGAVAKDGRMFATQYIGDGDSLGVIAFLDGAVQHLREMLGVDKVQAVAVDLHPGYANRKLGIGLARRERAELVEVQHHWAHTAALMVDAGEEEMVALTLDGTGYGDDGEAWGGEVLRADLTSYDRVAHLQPIPLLGGEKAVRDPRRLVFAMDELAGRPGEYFKDGEAAVLRKIIGASPTTTGFGRLLDALSCHFEVCQKRTYDGEPAMKLEAVLERGSVLPGLVAERRNGTVMTIPLFQQLREMKGAREDLALTYVAAVLESLVEAATEEASRRGLDAIGLTGGVSYNGVISSLTERMVRSRGLRFICPDRLPNGDGGISSGQCAIALRRVA